MPYDNILQTIGRTPHVRINRLFEGDAQVYLKLERANPGGSIKDRIGLAMIEDAEAQGELQPGMTIIEPTSGNTGIGLALAAAVKGYKLLLVMPESMSMERRRLMQAYGATFDLTPKEEGMGGAIRRAEELLQETDNSWSARQFANPANPEIHRQTTAKEILEDFGDIGLDALITGVGTGGHITGVGEILKERWPDLKVFAVEPEGSAVLSGNEPGPHGMQGIGAGFVPEVLNTEMLAGVITVGEEEAREESRQAALKEGILGGISSGATLAAIRKTLPQLGDAPKVLGFNYDTGERYFSVEGFLPE